MALTHTFWPGTTRRWAPAVYIGAGTDPSTASINTLVGNYFAGSNDLTPYLDLAGGQRFGISAEISNRSLFDNPAVKPTDMADPDDAGYDWTVIDNIAAANLFDDTPHADYDERAVWRIRLDFSKNTGSFLTNGTERYSPASGSRAVNFESVGGQAYVTDMLTAINTRYGGSPAFMGVSFDELEAPDTGWGTQGTTSQSVANDAFIQTIVDSADVLPNHIIGLFQMNQQKLDALPHTFIEFIHSDPKLFVDSAGTSGGVEGGVVDCDVNSQRYFIQGYGDTGSGKLIAGDAIHPTGMKSEPNGWIRTVAWPNPLDASIDPNGPGYAAGESHNPTEPDEHIWYHGVIIPVNTLILGDNPGAVTNQTPALWKAAIQKYGWGTGKDATWHSRVCQYPANFDVPSGSGVTLVAPLTIFIVAKFTDASPAADQFLFDAHSGATKKLRLFSDFSNSNKWTLDAGGTPKALTEAYDNDAHIFTIEYNADATTKLTVSGVGNVTGDAGSNEWDYCSTFMDIDGSNTMVGWIGEILIYDSALSASEILQNQNFLSMKWGL